MNSRDFLGKTLIYGKHAVIAALQNHHRFIHKIYLTNDNLSIIEPYKALYDRLKIISSQEFKTLLPNIKAHQNVLLVTERLNYSFSDLNLNKEHSLIACLDQITDPNNIGAILRSAAAFKADCLILPKDNAPQNFSSIYKISSGAAELVPLIQVVNLKNTLNQLKKHNYWIIGLDLDTENSFGETELPAKTVIVLGSENKGIRKLVKENCDLLYKIPMELSIDSLNVSNSAAISFYEYYKRYKSLLK